jgi:hypothetical protein
MQWLYGSGFPKSLNIAKNMDWVHAPPTLSKVYEVTKWIREARDAAGITNKDIDAATNTQMAGHWTTNKSQPAIPALHQVSELLNVLKLTPEQVPEHIVDVLLGDREKVSLREVLGIHILGGRAQRSHAHNIRRPRTHGGAKMGRVGNRAQAST